MDSDSHTVWSWIFPVLDFESLCAMAQTSSTFLKFSEATFKDVCRTELGLSETILGTDLFPKWLLSSIGINQPDEAEQFIEICGSQNISWRRILLSGLLTVKAARKRIMDAATINPIFKNIPNLISPFNLTPYYSNREFKATLEGERNFLKKNAEQYQDIYSTIIGLLMNLHPSIKNAAILCPNKYNELLDSHGIHHEITLIIFATIVSRLM